VSATIANMWTFDKVNGESQIILQMDDGSIFQAHLVNPPPWTWNLIVTAGGTTVGGLHFTKWTGADSQGNPEALLWVDTVKGYGSWDGTTWKVLQAGVTGQAIAVYAGRVWIASAMEILFTAPDAYNDFNAADYAGGFQLTDPTMQGPVHSLQVAQGWLYLIGWGMMALNNVQVQSVAGSTVLVTTYYLTPVSSSISIANDRAALVWDNTLFVVSTTGLWAYSGLNGQIVSANMGDNFSGTQTMFAATVYGKNLVVLSSGYVFMLEGQQWFTMIGDAQGWVATSYFIEDTTQSLVVANNQILKFGADFTTARACTMVTKLYDAGNASINKQVLKMGVELFPNELPQPVPTSLSISLTLQLLGYVSRSQAVNMLQSVNNLLPQNMFLPTTVNMLDRYFSLSAQLTASPGTSIGACFFQFMDSTPWPNRNIIVDTILPNPSPSVTVDQSPVTILVQN